MGTAMALLVVTLPLTLSSPSLDPQGYCAKSRTVMGETGADLVRRPLSQSVSLVVTREEKHVVSTTIAEFLETSGAAVELTASAGSLTHEGPPVLAAPRAFGRSGMGPQESFVGAAASSGPRRFEGSAAAVHPSTPSSPSDSLSPSGHSSPSGLTSVGLSGGLTSGGLTSGGLTSGGLTSGGLTFGLNRSEVLHGGPQGGEGGEGGAPPRRRSLRPECQATLGPRDDPHFLERVRPCGNLSAVCTDIPLIEANKDYPGGGIGGVVPDQDYLVQFDIGLHPAVARGIFRGRLQQIDSCLHCPSFGERCYEAVVTGGAMWGNLGMRDISSQAYDCMGACGEGCSLALTRTADDIGAWDCLKHDLCSAWKSVQSGRPTRGFCHDPDCGDEAAMSLYNCWRGFRLFGSLGGSASGPFSEPAVCDPSDPQVRGCWSHGGWFTQGRCKVFEGWDRGQGIPDPHPLRSPIQML